MFWVPPPLDVTPVPKVRWLRALIRVLAAVELSSLMSALPLIKTEGVAAEALRLSPMSLSLNASDPEMAAISCADQSPFNSATVVETALLLTEISCVWSLVPVMVKVRFWLVASPTCTA